MSQPEDFLDQLEQQGRVVVLRATGGSPADPLYAKAEQVWPARQPDQVYVSYLGIRYGPEPIRHDVLDNDPAKATVLIKTVQSQWVNLWFYADQANQPRTDQGAKK